MTRKPNPNLWSITYTTELSDNNPRLWICAGTAAAAEKKARAFLRKQRERRVRITRLSHQGAIDVF